MIRNLFHISFSHSAVTADVRSRAAARMTGTGLSVTKDPNPNALALRHAP